MRQSFGIAKVGPLSQWRVVRCDDMINAGSSDSKILINWAFQAIF